MGHEAFYWAGLNQNTRDLVDLDMVFLESMPKLCRSAWQLFVTDNFNIMQIKHIKQFTHDVPAPYQA